MNTLADWSPRPSRRGVVAGHRWRLPSQHGPQVTDRDIDILVWICRHGVVSPAQVARHFFARADGTVGQWAAYRRLRKLEQLALIRHDRTFWRETSVLRLTSAGSGLANIDVGVARLILAELRHTLAVVDLVETLLALSPAGTTLRTERELRIERLRELRDGSRKPGTGRIPDAVFVHPLGATVALELDLTPKRSKELDRILTAYRQERYNRVLWYVLPGQQQRLKEIIRKQLADDYVEVRAIPTALLARKS